MRPDLGALPIPSTASHSPLPPEPEAIIARLREVFGPELDLDASACRWWVPGTAPELGVALWMDRAPTPPRKPDGSPADDHGAPVIWVTRPGETKPERCPIITMHHLDAFLALVSIARRSPEPVNGNVCPGTE